MLGSMRYIATTCAGTRRLLGRIPALQAPAATLAGGFIRLFLGGKYPPDWSLSAAS